MIRPAGLVLLLLLAGPAGAATVVSVGDGDTMRVVEGGKRLTIRMACIDAPETAQRPYGAASRQRLQELAPVGSVVTLRPQTIDMYGRTVAEVFRNGQNTNLAMVSSGQAFVYRKYLAACDGSAYLGAEAAAQRQRLGVWAVPGGIQRPWEWRAERRESTTCILPTPCQRASARGLWGDDRRWRDAPATQRWRKWRGPLLLKNLSHQEAQRLLSQGHTYLDSDGDGEACERKR
jgi:endonuclease YncB( thermonuclease family)